MAPVRWLSSLVFTVTIVPALLAESHCPGNIASLPFRLLIGYHIVVPVYINQSGPYEFLLDTGTRMTMLGSSLADELHLEAQGAAGVVGLGFRGSASLTQLDTLEAGSHAMAKQMVLVYGSLNLRAIDPHIRGILGEDFLEHFDMLIDYAHNQLCLDDTAVMRSNVRGPHIALLATLRANDNVTVPKLLIIAAHLSGETRPVRLMLDSGANVPCLYNSSLYVNSQLMPFLVWNGPNGEQKLLSALPLQEVKIGSLELRDVTFFTLPPARQDSSNKEFDGFLSMILFRSVFISYVEHFAVLQPR